MHWWLDYMSTDAPGEMVDPLSMEEWAALREWHIEREIDAELDRYELMSFEEAEAQLGTCFP